MKGTLQYKKKWHLIINHWVTQQVPSLRAVLSWALRRKDVYDKVPLT